MPHDVSILPLMSAKRRKPRRNSAFTLVEILIVVVVLAILAIIILGLFGSATKDAAQSTFVTNVKSFGEAAMIYKAKTGLYPADGSSGLVPPGFEDYIDTNAWTRPTPIGGVWDAELNEMGVRSAIGVHFFGGGVVQDDAYMTEVDELFDNGDLASGAFRRIDVDRYYLVIADN